MQCLRLPSEWFLSISFFSVNGSYIPNYWYAMQFFVLIIGHFEYYNVVNYKIKFFLLPRVWCCNLLRTIVITLLSDFFTLFLQDCTPCQCVVIEVSVLLPKQSANDLREISLNAVGKKKWKQNKTENTPTLLVYADWL